MSDVEGHVQQALNELENGQRLGDDDAVLAARKRLSAAGATERDVRAAAAARRAAAEQSDTDEPAAKTPQGRQSPTAKKSTT